MSTVIPKQYRNGFKLYCPHAKKYYGKFFPRFEDIDSFLDWYVGDPRYIDTIHSAVTWEQALAHWKDATTIRPSENPPPASLNSIVRSHGIRPSTDPREYLVTGGHLSLLVWVWKEKDRFPHRDSVCPLPESRGYPEVSREKTLCFRAAGGGHLDVLKWLRDKGYDWDKDTCSDAATGGHLEVLKWARQDGCPWSTDTCSYAAGGGHLEVLKWVRLNGCPWNTYTCSHAAQGGHLEVLKWARLNGCPWNEQTLSNAAHGGHPEVSKWAKENGCP